MNNLAMVLMTAPRIPGNSFDGVGAKRAAQWVSVIPSLLHNNLAQVPWHTMISAVLRLQQAWRHNWRKFSTQPSDDPAAICNLADTYREPRRLASTQRFRRSAARTEALFGEHQATLTFEKQPRQLVQSSGPASGSGSAAEAVLEGWQRILRLHQKTLRANNLGDTLHALGDLTRARGLQRKRFNISAAHWAYRTPRDNERSGTDLPRPVTSIARNSCMKAARGAAGGPQSDGLCKSPC
jgi:hypothetical protein